MPISHVNRNNTILVTGGAGYIGSHMVDCLQRSGYQVVVYDNLSSGHRDAVGEAKLIEADLLDRDALKQCFSAHQFAAVIHFAGLIEVGQSNVDPARYYQVNVNGSLNLLNIMREFNVDKLVFSSTAAVYGEPQTIPIPEDHPKNPTNVYGRTKWQVEQMIADFSKAYHLRAISLRYFNAAGAHPKGHLSERHQPETHLIPLILQVAQGVRAKLDVFGNNYPTPDGTCIRDYIHVIDLCQAHLLALKALFAGAKTTAYNLGNGIGFSVLAVVKACRAITQCEIPLTIAAQRAGDPAQLVADATRARQVLNWQPQYPELATIIAHAWQALTTKQIG